MIAKLCHSVVSYSVPPLLPFIWTILAVFLKYNSVIRDFLPRILYRKIKGHDYDKSCVFCTKHYEKECFFYSFESISTNLCKFLISRQGRGHPFTNQFDINHVLSDIQSYLNIQVMRRPITKLTEGDFYSVVWQQLQLILLVICIFKLCKIMLMFCELYKHSDMLYPQH